MEKIYLAGPFFNKRQRKEILHYSSLLREKGYDVYVPMEGKITNSHNIHKNCWSRHTFLNDIAAIQNCDIVVSIYHGMTDDSGTCWEIGYAYGLKKKIGVIHSYPYKKRLSSLMVLNGSDIQFDKNLQLINMSEFFPS